MSARRLLGALAVMLGVSAVGATGACNAVLAIPDATLAQHVIRCTDGACVCEAGFDDCDGKRGDDCATDLGNDRHHCGACGHDCPGGDCKVGLCQPVVLATIPGARGLSLHGGSLLVGTCGRAGGDAFLEVPVSGGKPVTAVAFSHCGAAQVVLDDTLYWSDTSTLLTTQLTPQGAPSVLASTSAWKIVATKSHVYWGKLNPKGRAIGIMRLPLGGAPDSVYDQEVFALAAGAGAVYWAASDGVHGMADSALLDLPLSMLPARELATDATSLYIGTQSGIHALRLVDGKVSLLVPGANGARLTTDPTTLFWLDDAAGTVSRVPLAGGDPTLLAKGVSFTGTSVIAVDETFVYWLAGTVVARVPR